MAVSYTHLDVELPNQSTSSTMSKTNKNKAVDPDYAELKRENARLKAVSYTHLSVQLAVGIPRPL